MSATVVTKFGNRPVIQVPTFSFEQRYSNIVNISEEKGLPKRRQDREQQKQWIGFHNNYVNETNDPYLCYSHYPATQGFPQPSAQQGQHERIKDDGNIQASNLVHVNPDHQPRQGQYDRYNANFHGGLAITTCPENYNNAVGDVYPPNQNPTQPQMPPRYTNYVSVNPYDDSFSQHQNQSSNNAHNQLQKLNFQGNDEKHLYYGPNGQRLPGPQQYSSHDNFHKPTYRQSCRTKNFIIEGVLEYGHLTTIILKHSTLSLNEIPDFLIREMEKGYRNYKRTDVRIVGERGEYSIYATPHVSRTGPTRESIYEPKKTVHKIKPDNRTEDTEQPMMRKEWGTKIDPVEEYRSIDYFRDNVLDDSYGPRQNRRHWDRYQVKVNDSGW